ncbi:alpha-N-acetylglucosaminidase-like [Rhododendron vialii]|uniref:alpha-N-acetylglucosaminidase-like n=1 Tax=Rhododendron vialii TaxID=182163 RepID=UPI00265DBFAF|nr:alpha-N-acetylglucosaminidase-like [Rhododendron vialii]
MYLTLHFHLSKVGVGMSMEGIEQNPVAYDLMAKMAFQHDAVDVKMWIDTYSSRWYGRYVSSMQDAWSILYHTIYNCTDGAYDKNRDVIVAFPDIDPTLISLPKVFIWQRYDGNIKPISRRAFLEETMDGSYDQPHLWYSTSEVVRALELFIKSGDELSGSDTYRYDLVDLTRQALAKYANELFLMIIEAYRLGDVHGVAHRSQKFIELVEDMDTLLACQEGFLLGPWLESAKQLLLKMKSRKNK